MNRGRFARALIGDALDVSQALFQQPVGRAFDCRGDVGIRRAAIGRIIFEAAILRRIVRRRDDDAIGAAFAPVLVGGEDGVGDHRRRRVTVVRIDHHLDVIGREHLDRARQRRLRQRMRVDSDEQRTVDAAGAAMIANRLADRQDMCLVERVVEGGAAMAGSAKRHSLRDHCRIGLARKVSGDQTRDIRQHRRFGDLAGERIYFGGHGGSLG